MARKAITLGLALLLAALLGATVTVADRDWTIAATLRGHQAEVVAVALSQDAAHAASLDAAGRLVLWRLDSPAQVAQAKLGGRFVGRLKPGAATLAISNDGSTAAVAGAAFGTVVWQAQTQREPVVAPDGSPPPRLLALSPDGSILAGFGPGGDLRAWRTRSGEQLVQRSGWHPWPQGVNRIGFTLSGWAVWLAGPGTGHGPFLNPRSNQRVFEIAGSSSSSSGEVAVHRFGRSVRYTLQRWQIHLVDNVSQPTRRERFSRTIAAPLTSAVASAAGGGSPLANPAVAARVDVRMDAGRAIAGGPSGELLVLRERRPLDLLHHPAPYLALLAAMALPVFRITTRSWMEVLPARPELSLNEQPLPASIKGAIGIVAGVGLLSLAHIVWGLFNERLSLDLTALLVLGGIQMGRRRSDGWRKFAIFCTWCILLGVAAVLGMLVVGGTLEYQRGNTSGMLPPTLAWPVVLSGLGLGAWVWWALSNRHARLIFQAAAYPGDDLGWLRRCPGCGYDIKASVAIGTSECPECGQPLVYSPEQQDQIRTEFERERGDGETPTA